MHSYVEAFRYPQRSEWFSNEELQVENSLFLYQDVCTNGIGYVNIMFEIKDYGC